MGGFRFSHSSGRNDIVERGHRLLKVPSQRTKPVLGEEDLFAPDIQHGESNTKELVREEASSSSNLNMPHGAT